MLQLKKQKPFNYGQSYVALSRAKPLLGLTIVGNLKKEFVKAYPNVIKEYERLRHAPSFSKIPSLSRNPRYPHLS